MNEKALEVALKTKSKAMKFRQLVNASGLLLAVLIVTPLAQAAETFQNGESIYGQASPADGVERTVSIGSAKFINVGYGETVAFVNGNKRFAWTFNGYDGRPVELEKIAPADFGPVRLLVYVASDPCRHH